jgi:two-component system response regulator NreC
VKSIKIVLVDDHAVVRQGVRMILEEEPGFEVVGEAESGENALAVVFRENPDVVLMDVHMPSGIDGITATRRIISSLSHTAVLMLTMYDDEPHLERMLLAGASGVLFKHDPSSEIIQAIRNVDRGTPYLPQRIPDEVRRRLIAKLRNPDAHPSSLLTPRETEVLSLVANGYTNREIAQRLHISVKTVEAHRAHIVSRIGAENRSDLIQYALAHGLIAPIIE